MEQKRTGITDTLGQYCHFPFFEILPNILKRLSLEDLVFTNLRLISLERYLKIILLPI